MNETRFPKAGLWPAIAAVSGVLALLSALDTALSKIPFFLHPAFLRAVPATFAIYFFVILVLPLSIAVFIAAIMKRSAIALYGSIAILFSSLVWRMIQAGVFGGVTEFLPFAPLFSEYAFEDLSYFVYSAYVALDLVLAGVLLTLTILQHRRPQLSETETQLKGSATGRSAVAVFCRTCGTSGIANHFCQGCGSKLEA